MKKREKSKKPRKKPKASSASDNSGKEEQKQAYLLPEDADVALLKDYIAECFEYLDGAEAALLTLETDPDDDEAINTVFRAFHTIKGTSAFIGLELTAEFAHSAENFLNRIRDGEIRCVGHNADLALRSVDMLKVLTQDVEDALNGDVMTRPPGYDQLIAALTDADDAEATEKSGQKTSRSTKTKRKTKKAKSQSNAPAGNEEKQSSEDPLQAMKPEEHKKQTVAEETIRVRTSKLDKLIDLVGELVIAHSMISQDDVVKNVKNHELLRKVNHAGKIIREFQDLSLSMRMIPLKGTFRTMARLVRDLARKSGKQVNFIMEGEETEIDRNMVELIKDPLVHMVRNALDHGLESTEERQKAGKPTTGTLKLTAYHAGGNVIVEIQDDGRGLDKEKIVAKAKSKGVIEDGKDLSDQEIYDLIFSPGFSTAQQVSEISGRGVGLDVVRRNIEALNGHIDIRTESGQGTNFIVRIPLTLAITDGMLVKVGHERYIVPTASVYMVLRPDKDALSSIAGKGEMVVLRDELLPMFRLHRLFDIADAVQVPTEGLILIVGDSARRCALLVDELLEQQQVVVKTLGDEFGKIRGVAGAAILGDGRVGLIIDTTELVELGRQISVDLGSLNGYQTAA